MWSAVDPNCCSNCSANLKKKDGNYRTYKICFTIDAGDGSKTVEETSIYSALSTVFNLNFLPDSPDEIRLGNTFPLCLDCAFILKDLYRRFREFNYNRQPNSWLAAALSVISRNFFTHQDRPEPELITSDYDYNELHSERTATEKQGTTDNGTPTNPELLLFTVSSSTQTEVDSHISLENPKLTSMHVQTNITTLVDQGINTYLSGTTTLVDVEIQTELLQSESATMTDPMTGQSISIQTEGICLTNSETSMDISNTEIHTQTEIEVNEIFTQTSQKEIISSTIETQTEMDSSEKATSTELLVNLATTATQMEINLNDKAICTESPPAANRETQTELLDSTDITFTRIEVLEIPTADMEFDSNKETANSQMLANISDGRLTGFFNSVETQTKRVILVNAAIGTDLIKTFTASAQTEKSSKDAKTSTEPAVSSQTIETQTEATSTACANVQTIVLQSDQTTSMDEFKDSTSPGTVSTGSSAPLVAYDPSDSDAPVAFYRKHNSKEIISSSESDDIENTDTNSKKIVRQQLRSPKQHPQQLHYSCDSDDAMELKLKKSQPTRTSMYKRMPKTAKKTNLKVVSSTSRSKKLEVNYSSEDSVKIKSEKYSGDLSEKDRIELPLPLQLRRPQTRNQDKQQTANKVDDDHNLGFDFNSNGSPNRTTQHRPTVALEFSSPRSTKKSFPKRHSIVESRKNEVEMHSDSHSSEISDEDSADNSNNDVSQTPNDSGSSNHTPSLRLQRSSASSDSDFLEASGGISCLQDNNLSFKDKKANNVHWQQRKMFSSTELRTKATPSKTVSGMEASKTLPSTRNLFQIKRIASSLDEEVSESEHDKEALSEVLRKDTSHNKRLKVNYSSSEEDTETIGNFNNQSPLLLSTIGRSIEAKPTSEPSSSVNQRKSPRKRITFEEVTTPKRLVKPQKKSLNSDKFEEINLDTNPLHVFELLRSSSRVTAMPSNAITPISEQKSSVITTGKKETKITRNSYDSGAIFRATSHSKLEMDRKLVGFNVMSDVDSRSDEEDESNVILKKRTRKRAVSTDQSSASASSPKKMKKTISSIDVNQEKSRGVRNPTTTERNIGAFEADENNSESDSSDNEDSSNEPPPVAKGSGKSGKPQGARVGNSLVKKNNHDSVKKVIGASNSSSRHNCGLRTCLRRHRGENHDEDGDSSVQILDSTDDQSQNDLESSQSRRKFSTRIKNLGSFAIKKNNNSKMENKRSPVVKSPANRIDKRKPALRVNAGASTSNPANSKDLNEIIPAKIVAIKTESTYEKSFIVVETLPSRKEILQFKPTKNPPINCPKCSSCIYSLGSYRTHVSRKYLFADRFSCRQGNCDYTVANFASLKNHCLRHHSALPILAPDSTDKFQRIQKLVEELIDV